MSKRSEVEGQRPTSSEAAGVRQISHLPRAVSPSLDELVLRLENVARDLRQGRLESAKAELALIESALEQGPTRGASEAAGLANVRASLQVLHGRILQRTGQAEAARGRFEAAAALFEETTASGARDAWVHRDYGIALYELERRNAARRALEQARERGDQSFETVLYLGVLALFDGELAAAETLLRNALAKESLAPEAALNLAMALERSRRAEATAEAAEFYLRAGDLLTEQGRPEEALEAFRSAQQLKDDQYARLALGDLCRQLGRYEEAIAIVEKDQDFAYALATKGAALIALGRNEEALAALDRAVELEPVYGFGQGFRAEALRQLGRPKEALESLDRALAADPHNFFWLAVRGDVLRLLDRDDEALKSLDQSIALRADIAFAHGTRAAVLSRASRLEEALAAADRAIELDGNYDFAHFVRAEVLGKLGRFEEELAAWDRAVAVAPQSSFAHGRRGDALYRLDKLEEALSALDEAVKLDRDDAFAQARRGEVLRRLDRPKEALEALDRSVAVSPANAFAHLSRGEALRSLDRLDEALAALDRVIEFDGDNAYVQALRADVLRLLYRFEEALEAAEQALALGPSPADEAYAQFVRADVLRLQNAWKEALPAVDRAIELQPDFVLAHGTRGEVLRMLDRRQEALAALGRAEELDPEYAFAVASLGEVLRTLGRYREARSKIQRALELTGGQYAWAMGVRGIIELDTGEFAAALQAFEGAVALDSKAVPFAHVGKGHVLRLLERFQEASSAFEQAVERFPALPAARVHLADALILTGRREDAEEMLYQVAKELEEIDQPDAPDLSLLGWTQALLGHYERRRYDQAIRTYLDALSIDQNERQILFDIALTAMRAGRYALGLEEYQRAVKAARQEEPPRRRGLALMALRGLENAIGVSEMDRQQQPLADAIALLRQEAEQAVTSAASTS